MRIRKTFITFTAVLLAGSLAGCATSNNNNAGGQNDDNQTSFMRNDTNNNQATDRYGIRTGNNGQLDNIDGGKAGSDRYFGTLDNDQNNLNPRTGTNTRDNQYLVITERNTGNRNHNGDFNNMNNTDTGANHKYGNDNNYMNTGTNKNRTNKNNKTTPYGFSNSNNPMNDDGYGYYQDLSYHGYVKRNHFND